MKSLVFLVFHMSSKQGTDYRKFGWFVFIFVIFVIFSSSIVNGQGLWGDQRPQGKECLNFCNIFSVCNNGKCFMNNVTCRVECVCEFGYTGRWCKNKINDENGDDVGGSGSKNNTRPRHFFFGGGRTRSRGRKTPWGRRQSPMKLPSKQPIGIPPFVFKIEETEPPKENNTSSFKIEKEANITLNNTENGTDAKISNSTTDTLEDRGLFSPHENGGFDISPTTSLLNKMHGFTTTQMNIVVSTENVLDEKMELVSTESVLDKGGIRTEFQTTTVSHSSVRADGTESPTPMQLINDTSLSPEETVLVESFVTCQQNCKNGKCENIEGKYKCVSLSLSGNQTRDTRTCLSGFTCKHGHCDEENKKLSRYKCVCDSGWIGDFCDVPCKLDCGSHGACFYKTHKNKTGIGCLCDHRYTGVRCQTLRPKPSTDDEDDPWHWHVVGISLALVVIFIVTMVTLSYWLWRRRLVFIMRIVHYFQHYEEDDGKKFDAFVSYKSSKEDEQFVLQKLYPKLEVEMGFKLCMHFRDFVPGDAIANNIIKAIEDSRRTIMILSPNYIKSEWCRMEYQKAQHEMLKMRHKIIPVVLGDISEYKNVDKNLKTILNTVTYIEWPSESETKKVEKFWKQLALSLPKKRSNSHDQISSSDPVQSPSPPSSNKISSILSSTPSASTQPSKSNLGVQMISPGQISPAEQSSNKSSPESSTRKLRKMMKDVLKLKINNNHQRVLIRECSNDSSISSPLSDTPSPAFYSGKDFTPLLSRRLIQGKGSSKPAEKKPSTWSHRNKCKENGKLSTSVQHSHSMRESDLNNRPLDVIPQTPSVDCVSLDLPDICRTGNIGYYNIVCEEAFPPPSARDNSSAVDMNNFSISKDDMNIPVNNIHNNRDDKENAPVHDLGMNIVNRLTCSTCILQEKHGEGGIDYTSNMEDNIRASGCSQFNDLGQSSDHNALNIATGGAENRHFQTSNNSKNMNKRRNSSPIRCPTCVLNSNPSNNENEFDNMGLQKTRCPSCVLQMRVNKDNNEKRKENNLSLQKIGSGPDCENNADFINMNIIDNYSPAQNNNGVNMNLRHCLTSNQSKNNVPYYDIPEIIVTNVLDHRNTEPPKPPVRLKKLQRMNSKESIE